MFLDKSKQRSEARLAGYNVLPYRCVLRSQLAGNLLNWRGEQGTYQRIKRCRLR